MKQLALLSQSLIEFLEVSKNRILEGILKTGIYIKNRKIFDMLPLLGIISHIISFNFLSCAMLHTRVVNAYVSALATVYIYLPFSDLLQGISHSRTPIAKWLTLTDESEDPGSQTPSKADWEFCVGCQEVAAEHLQYPAIGRVAAVDAQALCG